ncbi:MAG: protein kinase [Lachnospiraceae bacterium]|nr:protein kinase [Lachnospiraceae bacterium]
MNMYRCANCMGEMSDGQAACPRCGFDAANYRQPPHAMKINTILAGRYLVGRVLGQGGFGITYVGYDLKLELKVAIKEYYPGNQAERNHTYSNNISWSFTSTQLQDWKDGVDRFLSEARKMARLDSLPGIIRVRDSFQENQTAYIIMDFAEGITLKKYLEENGPMDYRACVELLLPVMESLEIMHDKGLIHRDISPDNIMVHKKGKKMDVKLLDFGAAADLSHRRGGRSESVVKKGYSAPEQYLENGSIGRWTDVYAMACVIYRCVSGNQPPEAMERVMKKTTLTLDGIRSRKAQEVLARALALNADERTQSMAELRKDLLGTLPNGKKTRIRAAAGVAAAALCLVGVTLGVTKPWVQEEEQTTEIPTTDIVEEAVTIVTMGTSNSNMMNGSCFAGIYLQYEYYIDAEFNLHISSFDEEDGVFYLGGDTPTVDDEASSIVVGGDKVYFIHDNDLTIGQEAPETIYSMDPDGSNVTVLLTGSHDYKYLQYAELSTGERMLYFMRKTDDTENELYDILYTLCRYNLDTGEMETLLDENIYWYNLYDQYIYYVTFTEEGLYEQVTNLMRAELDGSSEEIINNTEYVCGGFIEGGTAWLYSLNSEQLIPFDLDGNKKETNDLKDYSEALYNSANVYYGDWIYYSLPGTCEIHKVRTDGTGETTIYSGTDEILAICYYNNILWVMMGSYVDTDLGYEVSETMLLAADDGEYLVGLD